MPTKEELQAAKAAADKALKDLEDAESARQAELAKNPPMGNLLHALLMEMASALGNNPNVEAALNAYKKAREPKE